MSDSIEFCGKKTLIQIGDWAVCSFASTKEDSDPAIYAEHVIGCNKTIEKDTAYWSWEYDDGICDVLSYRHGDRLNQPFDNLKTERCWPCGTPVPEEIVGLVVMHNWHRPRRYDE